MPTDGTVREQIQAAQRATREQVEAVAARIASQLEQSTVAAAPGGVLAFIGDIVDAIGNAVNDVANVGQNIVNDVANATNDIVNATADAVNFVTQNTDQVIQVTEAATQITPQLVDIIGGDITGGAAPEATPEQRQASAQQLLERRRSILEAQSGTRRRLGQVTQTLRERIESTRRSLA